MFNNSNRVSVSKKIDIGAPCNIIPLTILKKFDPLKNKKDHFDVLFIVVDSKSVPILGLSTSENLNLIKCISVVNVSNEQFLSEFSDCFGETRTLNNTHNIEIKNKVTHVVTLL